MVFGSGMAAISTIVNLLQAGDHIVSSVDLYGGTSVYLKNGELYIQVSLYFKYFIINYILKQTNSM
jgi:O-acetylhomoserine/O-acetylserine sulfhydrylase-like pyridoxal-dependent enzyme